MPGLCLTGDGQYKTVMCGLKRQKWQFDLHNGSGSFDRSAHPCIHPGRSEVLTCILFLLAVKINHPHKILEIDLKIIPLAR
jgi:hypothetical protein